MRDAAEIARANEFASYMRGWRHGAGAAAKDKAFTDHTDEGISREYLWGYDAGLSSRIAAGTEASARIGYDPSPFRATS